MAVRDVLDKPQAALRVVEVAATVTHGVAVSLVTIVYQSWRTLPVGFSDAKARETRTLAHGHTYSDVFDRGFTRSLILPLAWRGSVAPANGEDQREVG